LAARCVRLIEFARTSGSNDDATVLVVQRAQRLPLVSGPQAMVQS
jgi:hypothetical protein